MIALQNRSPWDWWTMRAGGRTGEGNRPDASGCANKGSHIIAIGLRREGEYFRIRAVGERWDQVKCRVCTLRRHHALQHRGPSMTILLRHKEEVLCHMLVCCDGVVTKSPLSQKVRGKGTTMTICQQMS